MEINPNQLFSVVVLQSADWGMEGNKEDGYYFRGSHGGGEVHAALYKIFTTEEEARACLSGCEDRVRSEPCDPSDPESPASFTEEFRYRVQQGINIPDTESVGYDYGRKGRFHTLWDGDRETVYGAG